ncbi:capsule assembly Wzi family protein [Lentisalinibacter sediminis]|uniref:capsule assembly Wzi family protein n=1 Tax=Lentisalinibacter sediminis TaxID=2992237 RepID=UPI00386A259F
MAEPWIAPGDPWLKSDIQRLADEGVIEGPVSSWPLSTGDIASGVETFHDMEAISAPAARALERTRDLVKQETRTGRWNTDGSVAFAEKPLEIRNFEDTPRGDVETRASTDYVGNRVAVKLQVGFSDDPIDDQDWRLDGSYAMLALGNWMVGAAAVDRWWGPGWGGDLILSNNARPIPAFVLQRNFSTPFETPLLSWLGPWSTSLIWGQLEDDRAVPNTRFFGWRVNFKPLPSLEIGLSRTAQWCGSGRPCDLDAFLKILAGDTNVEEGEGREGDEANQLAGFDARWLSPIGDLPYAVYGQFIGEDEAGGFPSRYMGMAGVEFWGRSEMLKTDWHAYAEFADTTCQFHEDSKIPNCAYNNGAYPTGYRYRERPIGYSTDNDARTVTAGVLAQHDKYGKWHISARVSELNRFGAPDERNTITATPKDLLDLSVTHSRDTKFGKLDLGVGVQQLDDKVADTDSTDVRVFVRLTQQFG